MTPGANASIVIATRNRRERLLQTLEHLVPLNEVARIVVADNASTDGTASAVRDIFPHVDVLQLKRNTGAFARTLGARRCITPYIAFCDDDTWWLPGSITTGVNVLERHPGIALLNACVTVGAEQRVDDACRAMAAQGPCDGLPGVPILFFLAGAALMRRCAFLQCGGYERRFLIGGEETLLALDLQRHGWLLRYLPTMIVRHEPSALERDDIQRQRLVMRNRLWVAWMRCERSSAWRATMTAVRNARHDRHARAAFADALSGLGWTLLRRRPVGAALQRRIDAVWCYDAR